MKDFLNKTNLLYWLGKMLVVGAFLYFGFTSMIDPGTFSGLVPDFVSNVVSADLLVMVHGAVEVACGLLILFGLAGVLPYLLLALSFAGVLVSVSGVTLVRDLAIMGGLVLLGHVAIKRGY